MRTPWDYIHECMEELTSPSVYDFGKRLKLSRSTIHNWIKGRTVPNEHHVLTMAKIINVDPRIALMERLCWLSAIDRDKKRLTCYMEILKVLTGEIPKLPDAYDYDLRPRYKFRTPESLVDT